MKLDEFIKFNPKESLSKGKCFKCVDMASLKPFTRKPDHFISIYKNGSKFRNGDTIMARITPCLENGKTSYINFLQQNEVAFGSTEFIVARAKTNVSLPLFIYYLLCSNRIREIAIGSMTGSSGRERVQQISLNEIEIPAYSISFQQHIVDTIGTIDDLIENYENQAHIICSLLKAELKKFSTVIPFSFYSPRIIKSGIKAFDTTKNYLDTSSVEGINEIFEGETITFGRRPSRANMQPIANSVWFAKMKASNKIIVVSEKDTDLITGTIFSTGFLGIEATKKLPLSLLTAFLISDSFHAKRDMCSVGTTMASINNDSFLRITVPYLNNKEIDLFESKYKYSVQTLCLLRRKIVHLKQAKADLLTKYF